MRISVFCLLFVLLFSCVSKKKYQASIATCNLQTDSLRQVLDRREQRIALLSRDSVKMKGANEALLATQQHFFEQLDALKAEVDLLNASSDSAQQALLARLADKEANNRILQRQIQDAGLVFGKRLRRMQQIADRLDGYLRAYPINRWALDARKTETVISLQEGLLCSAGSTGKLTAQGEEVLARVAEVVQSYPEFVVDVLGHTDNQPVRRSSLGNWEYSALRAVTVAKALLELGLLPNQLSAIGKSEYAPRRSNETAEGRSQNRRVELRFRFRESDLIRDLERVLKSSD
jgi:chemotaxis protein MotB